MKKANLSSSQIRIVAELIVAFGSFGFAFCSEASRLKSQHRFDSIRSDTPAVLFRSPLLSSRCSVCFATSAMEMASKDQINEQTIANTYAAMRSEINQIYSKITELEMEVNEHNLVIGAIEPLDPTRRCYRMVGGVLVERTVKEVLPAVKRNKEGIEEVIARLNEALEKKKKELTEFELKFKIRIRRGEREESGEEASAKKEGAAQGVLVGPA
ncbi:Prefoldin subunit 2 [Rhynchospora pubera]|uniref:Prefoldin subunit 2 n=1 Tax=Rhynchospora pubera TaxID=906938 RepID=A0AAV8EF91_9POAL|nr:Prefoldin subunit 2 [Rhynchospora pubera]